MMTRIRILVPILVTLSVLLPGTVLLDPAKSESIPPGVMNQYHVDLGRYFFASPAEESAERSRLDVILKELEKLKGGVVSGPGSLLQALQLYDRALIKFNKHESYLYLLSSQDTKDEGSADQDSAIVAEFNKRTAFLQQELRSLDAAKISRWCAQKPELQPYRYFLESGARSAPHDLPLDQQELLEVLSPLALDWQDDLYGRLLSRTPFGSVHIHDSDLDVWKDRRAIDRSADRAAREAAFRKRMDALNSQRDLYAFALIRLVKARNQVARLRKFPDAPEQVYFDNNLTGATIRRWFEEIGKGAEVYKEYQRLRADKVKQANGYSEIYVWDLNAPAKGVASASFTILQATDDLQKSLAVLGPEYGKELSALLDPANRRLDLAGGENRAGGGFSLGFPGFTSVFYSESFAGAYNDARVLTHESTHAVHRELMNRRGVLPVNADGPKYFFESFAIFSELLWGEYLYEHETDPQKKIFLLQQLLDSKGLEVFRAAHDASLEQVIYDGVGAGKITDADDLDAVTKQVDSRYSIWADKQDEMKSQWITMRLMFEDPLYLVNYMVAGLLSLEYYERYRQSPETFIPQYIDLMKNGFDAPPDVLLRRLGIDLNDPALVARSIATLRAKVDAYRSEVQAGGTITSPGSDRNR